MIKILLLSIFVIVLANLFIVSGNNELAMKNQYNVEFLLKWGCMDET